MKILKYLIIIATIYSCSKEGKKNDLSKEKLFGNVKSVERVTYSTYKEFDKFLKKDILNSSRIIFNKEGYIIDKIFSDEANTTRTKYEYLDNYLTVNKILLDEKGDNKSFIQFKYDKNQNLLSEINYNKDGSVFMKTINEYDLLNYKIRNSYGLNIHNLKSTSSYFSNVNHDLKESKTYHIRTTENDTILFSYARFDEKLNEISIELYDEKGLKGKTIRDYDSKNNLLKRSIYKMNKLEEKLIYVYNEYNLEIKNEITSFSEDYIHFENISSYKYDKNKNWIMKQQIITDIDNTDLKESQISERKITYY